MARRTGFVVLISTIALLASACGGTSDSTTLVTSDEDRPQSFEDLDFDSPLGDFLGFDFGDRDDMEEQFAEMERVAGRLTAECMLDKGFEYTPMETISFSGFSSPDELAYFSDEWVEKYGFGVTTQRFPQSMVGDLVGFPDETMLGPGSDDFEDPNAAYIDGLSDGERDAFYEALQGPPTEMPPGGPDEEFEQQMQFGPRGCQGEAFDEAFAEGPGGNDDAFFNAFEDQLEEMGRRADADPRIVEYKANVTSCVSEAGMQYIDQEDLYQRWEREISSLQPGGGFGGDPLIEAGLDPSQMSQREIDEFYQNINRLDSQALAVLAEIQQEELALAKVVMGCGGGPLNEQYELGKVRAEYEQKFLDENADALEPFRNQG